MNYRKSYNSRPQIVKPFQQVINASTNNNINEMENRNQTNNNQDNSFDKAIERAVGTSSSANSHTSSNQQALPRTNQARPQSVGTQQQARPQQGAQGAGMPPRGPKRRTQINRHKRADPTKRTVANASDVQKAPESLHIPSVGENIRIIPLGGVEEIGMNMSLVEIGNDIVIMDAGFKFKDTDKMYLFFFFFLLFFRNLNWLYFLNNWLIINDY